MTRRSTLRDNMPCPEPTAVPRMPVPGLQSAPAGAPHLHPGMLTTLPGGEYLLPASLHPLFLVVLSGRVGLLEHGDFVDMGSISLCGGTRSTRRACAAPGTCILTLSVRPGRLPRLLGMSAVDVMERWFPLDALLDGRERGELRRCEAGLHEARLQPDRLDAVRRLLDALLERRSEVAAELALPNEWMRHPPAAIAARLGWSARQLERRFLRSYGQSLRSYRHQLRASLTIASLVCGRPSISSWTHVAAEVGYCDQSHLHHDLLRFTGRTPGELAAGIAGDDPAFWPYRVPSRSMFRHFGPSGY